MGLKQSISLIEVLVSIMIISVVIVSLLQIKENNLYFLQKSIGLSNTNDYISLVALDDNKKLNNNNIFLENVINFNDDKIRKELKSVKINVNNVNLKPLEFTANEYKLFLNIKQTNFSIVDDLEYHKSFFRFSIND